MEVCTFDRGLFAHLFSSVRRHPRLIDQAAVRRPLRKLGALWLGVVAGLAPATPDAAPEVPTHELSARVVAVGVNGVAGVRQIGMFHAGGAIPGNPEFLAQTRRNRVLDPERVMVTSRSNFGAAPADPGLATGAVLSIDTKRAPTLRIPPRFAAGATAQAAIEDGAVRLYSSQSKPFLNRRYNPRAQTANLTGVTGPRYISINNGFGRPWFANAALDPRGLGTSSVLDPNGAPLDNAPSRAAGGVFATTVTNRLNGQYTHGDIAHDALGTAFLGPSPDATGFAVFAVVKADGSVVQVHVQDGVDGLAPPATVSPVSAASTDGPGLIGTAFKWTPERVLYVADGARHRIVALTLGDDARHFVVTRTAALRSPLLRAPSDICPTIPEVANPRFGSHTTLAGNSDLYVVNRGDGSLLRMSQEGRVLARARVHVAGLGPIGPDRLRGIAVSADAQRLWVTVQGELPGHPGYEGALLELSAFDAAGAFRQARPSAAAIADAEHMELAHRGERAFLRSYGVHEGLGPRFNADSCLPCHNEPSAGGMSTREENYVARVGRIHPVTGRAEALDDPNAPVVRRHALRHRGTQSGGIPRAANVVSVRMPPVLYHVALIDQIPDAAILAHAINKGDGIHGRPNRVTTARGDRRVGRFGWKADIATLEEMVAVAFSNEIGITSPLAVDPTPAGAASATMDDDGSLAQAVTAFLRRLLAPEPNGPDP